MSNPCQKNRMRTVIISLVIAALIVAVIIFHERDPEKKFHLQEHQQPKK